MILNVGKYYSSVYVVTGLEILRLDNTTLGFSIGFELTPQTRRISSRHVSNN